MGSRRPPHPAVLAGHFPRHLRSSRHRETTAIREGGAASGIGVLATIAYDDLGRRKSLTLGNGVATKYTYDTASRLDEPKLEFAAATNNLTSTFTYNPAGQIAKNERSNVAYSWTGHGSGTTVATTDGVAQSANGLNQIGSWVTSLGYDPKGNLTSDGTYTYTYSSENLLTSLTNSAPGAAQPSIAFSYDPLLRLASIDSTVSGFDVEFGYDGQDMVLEALSAGRTRRYVHGPGTDEPLVAYLVTPGFPTARNWYQADERGSIVRLSTDTGPGTIGRYDEYGAGGSGRFRYTGQYWLGEANLLYYRARVYDARLGRFLQPDPIGYGDGMNMYAYVGGDPVNFNDPTGLTCVSWREGGGVSEGPGGITVTAGKLVSGCWSDGGGGGPTRYFDGNGGGGGGGDGGATQCSVPQGRAAGTVAIPIPKAPSSITGGAAAGILRILGVLGTVLSLSGDSAKHYAPIFRAVGPNELAQIQATQQFGPSPSGFGEKQFWLNLSDARWFAERTVSLGWEPNSTIVTTSVSARTMSFGKPFSDAGHPAISFPSWAISAVNYDAKETGIKVVERCGG